MTNRNKGKLQLHKIDEFVNKLFFVQVIFGKSGEMAFK